MEKISALASLPVQISSVKLLVKWATDQNRVYLRQSLETRLVSLYLETKSYSDALELINSLLKELKKLDDKMALIEVNLLESKCFHSLRNLPKSRVHLNLFTTISHHRADDISASYLHLILAK
jgi:26S proteasome regulatory subunit N6